jgi:hypothetical protein
MYQHGEAHDIFNHWNVVIEEILEKSIFHQVTQISAKQVCRKSFATMEILKKVNQKY